MRKKKEKSEFSIAILICKFQYLLDKFEFPLVFSPNVQRFAATFLKFF